MPAIPEPGTILLLGFGALSALAMQRRFARTQWLIAAAIFASTASVPLAESATLYSEGFDSSAADVKLNRSADSAVDFVDYSNFTVGATSFAIPEAPNMVAGSSATHGVLMRVNQTGTPGGTGAPAVINMLAGATPIDFSGNYAVSYDVYMNTSNPSGIGSTQQALFGLGTNDDAVLEAAFNRGAGTVGTWGWLTNENGSSTEDAAINQNGAELADIGDADSQDVSAGISPSLFNAAFIDTNLTTNSSPARQWVSVELRIVQGQATVLFNGVRFFGNSKDPNTNSTSNAGFAMLGFEDRFASISSQPDLSWALFDNFVVREIATTAPGIFKWEYIDPLNPSLGKQQSAELTIDGSGLFPGPVLNAAGKNLADAFLRGADLTSSVFNSTIVTRAFLYNANLTNVNFTGANLTDADLNYADLTYANLSNADLTRTVFVAARLSGTDFSGAKVREANFTRTIVDHPCTSGWAFCVPSFDLYGGITAAQLASTGSYVEGDLSGINLSNNNLTGIDLAGINLTNAVLYGTTLTGANLSGANIRGANFGRYSHTVGCSSVYQGCPLEFTVVFGGLTFSQLSATASYIMHDLTGVNLAGNDLTGGNFVEQNLANAIFTNADLTNADFSHAYLTNADFSSATLAGANLTGADARGSLFTSAVLTGALTTNFVRSDGHSSGLDLAAGQSVVVRDYDGDPARSLAPIPITVDQYFAMETGSTLRMVFEADAWDSTISFAAGIPVTLGGTFELLFMNGTDPATQVGRTFKLFDWTGVAPTGAFAVSSPYAWNLSDLYTTGEVTLTAVPEPNTLATLLLGVLLILTPRRALVS